MKINKETVRYITAIWLLIGASSCVDLTPEPLSFGDAFNAGYCETPIVYEYAFSDLSVIGSPPVKEIHDLKTQLTPTANAALHLRYWDLAWNGIKYANTVITRVPKSNITNEEDKNQLLAEGYFHRAY